jgi:hypothetical protein
MKIENELYLFNFSEILQYTGKEVDALITAFNIGTADKSYFVEYEYQ